MIPQIRLLSLAWIYFFTATSSSQQWKKRRLALALLNRAPRAGAMFTHRSHAYCPQLPMAKQLFLMGLGSFCLLFSLKLGAQTPLFPVATFDNAALNPWTAMGNSTFNANGRAAGLDMFWSYPDGTDRPRIQSASLGGAVVLRGDDITDGGRLVSTGLDFSQQSSVFIGFHQYYRNFEGETRLNLYQGGVLLQSILLNTNINPNVETAPSDYVAIDIGPWVRNRDNIRVELELTGSSYFWIIDDIGFYSSLPFSPTRPVAIGQYLADNEYPFAVDTAHWPYVPYQLVVQIAPGADPDSLQAIRDSIGARKLKDCVCGKIELWEIDGSLYFDAGGQSNAGGTTDIYSNKLGVGGQSKVDGVDINYYNNILLDTNAVVPIAPLSDADIASLPTAQPAAHRIAIIDSGIDYTHPDLDGFIAKKDDSQCYNNDPLGWNFVDSLNNPFDDNSHGTHVAGILVDSLRKYSPGDCHYQLVPYKTHDRNGISTLFAVACATFQAIEDSVSLINSSWGFFGDSSIVLSNAIDSAALANITIISAAGNDGLGLDTLRQYPACYVKDNVIAVGATDTIFFEEGDILLSQLAPFSNYSNTQVDIAAPGTHIQSAIPGGSRDFKSGTSMATPMVSAAIALSYCCNAKDDNPENDGYLSHRDTVLGWTSFEPLLPPFVQEGRFLGYDLRCRTVDTHSPEAPTAASYRAFPNPSYGTLQITNLGQAGRTASWQITDSQGRLVLRQERVYWPADGSVSLDLGSLPSGMYFLFIRGDDYLWSSKIIRY